MKDCIKVILIGTCKKMLKIHRHKFFLEYAFEVKINIDEINQNHKQL